MIPPVPEILRIFAADLSEIAPSIQPSFRGTSVLQIAILLTRLSEGWDDAAQTLVDENQALRELFASILPVIQTPALRNAIEAHVVSKETNFRISALTAVNEAMRATLINAHTAIELIDGAKARAAEDAIWKELRLSTERRHYSTDLFY